MNYITPETISQIAGSLGKSQNVVQEAIKLVIPAMLGKFAQAAAAPGGADRIFRAVQQVDPGMLENVGRGLRQQTGQAGVTSAGSLISTLLGGSSFDTLKSTLARYTGLNADSIGQLAGLVMPILLGVLGKVQKQHGLDAAGLASLLGQQSGAISSMLPQGLMNDLGGGSNATVERRTATPQREAASSSSFGVLRWALPLALIAVGGLWAFNQYMTPRAGPEVRAKGAPITPVAAPSISAVALADSVTRAGTLLSNLQDPAQVQSAVAQIQELVARFDQGELSIKAMTREQKSTLAGAMKAHMPMIAQQVERILSMPGLPQDAAPALKSLQAEAEQLSTAARA